MEDQKPTDKYNFSKRPLNFRPRPDQKEFIITLLEANAGSQQKAIEHCVTLAMDPARTITITKENAGSADQQKEIERLNKLLKDRDNTIANFKGTNSNSEDIIAELKQQIATLKAAPKPAGGLTLSDAAKVHLEKIKKAKKLGTIDEVIVYALNYTFKNDWL